MRFDTDVTDTLVGTGNWPSVGINERGGTFGQIHIQTIEGGALSPGPSPTNPGFVRSAASFSSLSFMDGTISPDTAQYGVDGADGALSVECMVNLGHEAWAALSAPGDAPRYCPVVSMLSSQGEVVWTLGFASWVVSDRGGRPMRLPSIPVSIIQLTSQGWLGGLSTLAIAQPLSARQDRYIHLCAERKVGNNGWFEHGVWFDGNPGLYYSTEQIDKLRASSRGLVRLGGGIPGVIDLGVPGVAELVRFTGGLDELRITAATRRGAQLRLNMLALPPSLRVIPWPNY